MTGIFALTVLVGILLATRASACGLAEYDAAAKCLTDNGMSANVVTSIAAAQSTMKTVCSKVDILLCCIDKAVGDCTSGLSTGQYAVSLSFYRNLKVTYKGICANIDDYMNGINNCVLGYDTQNPPFTAQQLLDANTCVTDSATAYTTAMSNFDGATWGSICSDAETLYTCYTDLMNLYQCGTYFNTLLANLIHVSYPAPCVTQRAGAVWDVKYGSLAACLGSRHSMYLPLMGWACVMSVVWLFL